MLLGNFSGLKLTLLSVDQVYLQTSKPHLKTYSKRRGDELHSCYDTWARMAEDNDIVIEPAGSGEAVLSELMTRAQKSKRYQRTNAEHVS